MSRFESYLPMLLLWLLWTRCRLVESLERMTLAPYCRAVNEQLNVKKQFGVRRADEISDRLTLAYQLQFSGFKAFLIKQINVYHLRQAG